MKSLLQARYAEIYSEARYGAKKDRAHVLYHTKLEMHLTKKTYPVVLEIGAGSGEHFIYVKHDFEKYIMSDIVLPVINHDSKSLNKNARDKHSRVICKKEDAEDLKLASDSVDRLISTCVLHHLHDPSTALDEMRRVVKNNGLVSIYLPSDPGFLYRAAQYMASNRKLRKFFSKNEIRFLRGLEHRNHVSSLEAMISATFINDEMKRRDFPLPATWNFRLFSIYQVKIVKNEK